MVDIFSYPSLWTKTTGYKSSTKNQYPNQSRWNSVNTQTFHHVVFLLPEENFFHGGYRSAVAGDAQLLPVHLQFGKQQLKPEAKAETGVNHDNTWVTARHWEETLPLGSGNAFNECQILYVLTYYYKIEQRWDGRWK